MDAMIAGDGRGYLTAAAVNLVMSAREDPADARGRARRHARRARRSAAGVGAARARARPRHARLRPRPDGAASAPAPPRLGHGARSTCTAVARPGRWSCSNGACCERFPGLRDRRRPLASVPRSSPPMRRTRRSQRSTAPGPRSCGSASASPSRSGGWRGCGPACTRRCSSAWAPPSTSTPASSPRRRRGCSGTAWSGSTGCRGSPGACGGATPATTPGSWPVSRASTCASAARTKPQSRYGSLSTVQRDSAPSADRTALTSCLDARPRKRTADVAVIGLGRVGLPLALSFADRGLRVIGVDNDPPASTPCATGRCPSRRPAPRSCSTACTPAAA